MPSPLWRWRSCGPPSRIYLREGQALRQPSAQELLCLDIALTRRAPRGSQHERLLQWGKNHHGRQLARVSAPQYHESLVSLGYPGNQTSQACLHPTVAAVERVLGVPPAQRRRTVRRLDGGFGTDANLNWALWHGYQVLAQGYSGKRAKAFARAVPHWEALRAGAR
jgi:hypothetical protein